VIVDPDFNSGSASILKDFREGIRVPVLTLEDVLSYDDLLNGDSPILKMDCEAVSMRLFFLLTTIYSENLAI
jgi:hypothetical protein